MINSDLSDVFNEHLLMIRQKYKAITGNDLKMEINLSHESFDNVIRDFSKHERFYYSSISDFRIIGFRINARRIEE